MVVINGEQKAAEGLSLQQYLEEAGFDVARVVAEVNLEIVPKDRWSEVTLKDGDTVEVLRFVGGG